MDLITFFSHVPGIILLFCGVRVVKMAIDQEKKERGGNENARS